MHICTAAVKQVLSNGCFCSENELDVNAQILQSDDTGKSSRRGNVSMADRALLLIKSYFYKAEFQKQQISNSINFRNYKQFVS